MSRTLRGVDLETTRRGVLVHRLVEVLGSRTEHLITHAISSRVACETSHLARAIDEEGLLTEREGRELSRPLNILPINARHYLILNW